MRIASTTNGSRTYTFLVRVTSDTNCTVDACRPTWEAITTFWNLWRFALFVQTGEAIGTNLEAVITADGPWPTWDDALFLEFMTNTDSPIYAYRPSFLAVSSFGNGWLLAGPIYAFVARGADRILIIIANTTDDAGNNTQSAPIVACTNRLVSTDWRLVVTVPTFRNTGFLADTFNTLEAIHANRIFVCRAGPILWHRCDALLVHFLSNADSTILTRGIIGCAITTLRDWWRNTCHAITIKAIGTNRKWIRTRTRATDLNWNGTNLTFIRSGTNSSLRTNGSGGETVAALRNIGITTAVPQAFNSRSADPEWVTTTALSNAHRANAFLSNQSSGTKKAICAYGALLQTTLSNGKDASSIGWSPKGYSHRKREYKRRHRLVAVPALVGYLVLREFDMMIVDRGRRICTWWPSLFLYQLGIVDSPVC